MTALTGEELHAWVERTSTGWRELLTGHPEALALPCDVRETTTVAELVKHIVAVELRYAQRLHDTRQSTYDEISSNSVADLYAVHDRAMSLVSDLLSRDDFPWDEEIDFVTRSAGTLRATRKTILFHLYTHSIRHYAQLATLVRHHGINPAWEMDYLFMQATSA